MAEADAKESGLHAAPLLHELAGRLDRPRILKLCRLLLIFEVALFLFFAAGTHGWIVPLKKPTSSDFVSFYAAGALANAGTPALAYDRAAHYAAEEQATVSGIPYQFFYYPPVYLFLCAALARLPYVLAFTLFEAATLVLYLFVGCRILGEDGAAMLIPLLAFPPVFWTWGLGQNAFLTAALFGAATLLVDRRPVLSGLLFGLLCYKPHFGLLVPIALAAGGRWRAFAAAAATVATLVAASLLAYGGETWRAFFATGLAAHTTYDSGRIALFGFVTPWGGALLAGAKPALAGVIQAMATVAAAAVVALAWRRQLPLPLRAAALAAATLVAVPVALVYDLMLAAIAMLWLVRARGAGGMPGPEKVALAAMLAVIVFGGLLLAFGRGGNGPAMHIPFFPLALLGLFALITRRIWQEAREGAAA